MLTPSFFILPSDRKGREEGCELRIEDRNYRTVLGSVIARMGLLECCGKR
jgi:hypothetical protein